MNENIIKFYLITNKLKEKIRTGWMNVNISSDRLESVAEHVYGCLMLAIAIDSEYDLDVDMYKVLKMLALHELEETIIKDYTVRDKITREEKLEQGRASVKMVTEGLIAQNEIEDLLEEYNAHESKESVFCYHIDKIECDFQAKIYDLNGYFSKEEALKDRAFHEEEYRAKIENINNASDVWIEYDKRLYKDDNLFKNLIEDIQKIDKK